MTALENRTLASLIRWSLYPRELDEEKLMEKFLTMVQKDVFDDYDTKVVSVYSIQLSGLDILKTLEVGKPWDEIHEAVKVICDTQSLSKSDIVLPVRVHIKHVLHQCFHAITDAVSGQIREATCAEDAKAYTRQACKCPFKFCIGALPRLYIIHLHNVLYFPFIYS